jgi:dTMP kinase
MNVYVNLLMQLLLQPHDRAHEQVLMEEWAGLPEDEKLATALPAPDEAFFEAFFRSYGARAYVRTSEKMQEACRRLRGGLSPEIDKLNDEGEVLWEGLGPYLKQCIALLPYDDACLSGPQPSRLFVFEGMDGAGTTTQTALLANRLRKDFDVPVRQIAQPSTGPIGTMIRQMLSKRLTAAGGSTVCSDTLALLFAADRRDQQQDVLEPLKRQSALVVCDRHIPSSMVYQWDGCSDPAWLTQINQKVAPPDHTFFLRVPLKVALGRVAARGGALDIFEKEEAMTLWHTRYERVAADMLKSEGPGKVTILDGEQPEMVIHQQAHHTLKKHGLI